MPIAKHFILENGVLKVTDKPIPMLPPEDGETYDYNATLESWNQEALVVSNPEILEATKDFAKIGSKIPDHIYIAPAGLEYEAVCKGMMKENCHNDEECWDKNNCLSKQRVAILSFASPKKETNKDWVKEQVDRFQKFLDSMPDEELDKIVKQVEESGIKGPTVEEYFAGLGGRKEIGAGDDYPVVISEVEYQKEKCSTCGLSKNHPAAKLCSNSFHLSVTPASKEKPDFYSLLSSLVTTYQQDIEDWGIDTDKLPQKALKTIVDKINYQNECLKTLAVGLRASYELKIAALQEEIRQLKNKQ